MFLTIKLCTHAKLNCLQIEMIICIKMDLALNNLQTTKPCCCLDNTTYTVYVHIVTAN